MNLIARSGERNIRIASKIAIYDSIALVPFRRLSFSRHQSWNRVINNNLPPSYEKQLSRTDDQWRDLCQSYLYTVVCRRNWLCRMISRLPMKNSLGNLVPCISFFYIFTRKGHEWIRILSGHESRKTCFENDANIPRSDYAKLQSTRSKITKLYPSLFIRIINRSNHNVFTHSYRRYIGVAEAGPIGTPVISTRGSIAQTSVLRNNNVVSLYIQAVVFAFIGRRVFTIAMAAVQKFAFYYTYLSPRYNFFTRSVIHRKIAKKKNQEEMKFHWINAGRDNPVNRTPTRKISA